MALLRTTAEPHQTMELVAINSSPIEARGGPNPRVIKRKNNRYMRPRSPISPSRNIMAQISGSSIARFQNNYLNMDGEIFFSSWKDASCDNVLTNTYFLVSKLQVNQLQLKKVNDQHANQSSPTCTLFSSVRLWMSANSGNIDVADEVQDIFSVKIWLDLQLAPIFNPSDNRNFNLLSIT